MRGRRKKVQIILEAVRELIGGKKKIQPIFPKEDQAWTVENDLILEAQLQEKEGSESRVRLSHRESYIIKHRGTFRKQS